MKLIKPSFEIYEQGPGLEGIYEAIERAGRTCYRSQRPEGQTAKNFVDRMIKSGHGAMLEHGTIYLRVPYYYLDAGNTIPYYEGTAVAKKYGHNKYSKVVYEYTNEDNDIAEVYITTNYRVLVENDWLDDLKYLCEPTESHEKRVTVRFITDRGISHELVRHRVFSFAQESTRYCNYSKDKFGNGLTFIIPSWMDSNEQSINTKQGFGVKPREELFAFLGKSERHYFKLLELGWTPQQARQVLPNALKTELVMTGFTSDWQHFCRLRTSIIAETGKPHPDMSALIDPLYKEFVDRGYMIPLI